MKRPLNLLLLLVAVYHVAATPLESKAVSKHPLILVVSYDGFRYDYLEKAELPNMKTLRTNGVGVPYMYAAFPANTMPNHHCISTGLLPESHGVVDNQFIDPVEGKISAFDVPPNPKFWYYRPDVMPVWIRNELAGDGRVSGAYMWPGCDVHYGPNSDLRPTHFEAYNGTISWEQRVDTVITWFTHAEKPANLVFLYYSQPDSVGHSFGPNSNETLEQIKEADVRTKYLVDKLTEAELMDKVNLILTSDHGMQAVTEERTTNLTQIINMDLVETLFGWNPNFQIVPKAGKKDELFHSLREKASMGYSVFLKESLTGYPFHYSASDRISDIVMVADPGFAFINDIDETQGKNREYDLHANEFGERGVHGYSNMADHMRPFFIAHGPAFQKGLEAPPMYNVDIVPLISTIAGFTPPPNNGSLERVIGMLKEATGAGAKQDTTWTIYVAFSVFSLVYKLV